MEALETLFQALIPISICAVLPVLIVWLYMRNKTNETNRRAEIMKLAIENNTQQTDLSGLLSSLNKKEKGVKERLLNRLQLGAMSTALGLALLGAAIWQDYQGGAGPESLQDMYLAGAIFLQEKMSGKEYLGCVLMLIAVVLAQIPMPIKKKKAVAE